MPAASTSRMSPSTTSTVAVGHRGGEVVEATTGEIVEHDDVTVGAVGLPVDQQIDDVRPDQTGTAGDEDLLVRRHQSAPFVSAHSVERGNDHAPAGRRSSPGTSAATALRRLPFRSAGSRHAVAELGERLLQVDRDRVVDAARDLAFGQERLEFLPLGRANGVDVVHVPQVGRGSRCPVPEAAERLVVAGRQPASALGPAPRCGPSSPAARRPARPPCGS